MRTHYNTIKYRSDAVGLLSYWDDNSAGYSFWGNRDDFDQWGTTETLMASLQNSYREQGVNIRAWEIDCNFEREDVFEDGWCFKNWSKWNSTVFPSGGEAFYESLGNNISMSYYMSAFCGDTDYKGEYDFVSVKSTGPASDPNVSVITPDGAYKFYHDILSNAKTKWNMQHLFTDFLCVRGPGVDDALTGKYFEPSYNWLKGMTMAAQDLGLEVQYCMARPTQILESLRYPAVTNARVNADGGLHVQQLTYNSVYTAAVGVAWSKDNLKLITWHQKPQYWGVNFIQACLAIYSLGPVGLSDVMDTYPKPPNSTSKVVTNVTLANSLSTVDGQLLQPSYPLTPIDVQLAMTVPGIDKFDCNIWTTHTAINQEYLFFIILGFSWGNNCTTYGLDPLDVTSIIDPDNVSLTDYSQIPVERYLSNDNILTYEKYQFVYWNPQDIGNFKILSPYTSKIPITLLKYIPDRWFFSMILLKKFVLFGETDKLNTNIHL
eukprot:UN25475